MNGKAKSEQRTHFRGKARLHRRVELAFCPVDSESDDLITASTRDISVGGAFIEHDRPLPIGTELYMELYVPTSEEPLEIDAEVRWIVPPGGDGIVPGMGVEFLDLSVDALLMLNEYFASLTGTESDG
jgi:uncharacterized protein (TIGR02266 family)